MKGIIYFAQMQSGPIKIGCTTDLDVRLSKIGITVPGGVVLLTSFPGDLSTEGWVHQRFRSAKISGEWFRDEPELMAFIRRAAIAGQEVVPLQFRNSEIDKQVGIVTTEETKERFAFYLRRIAEPVKAGESIRKQIERSADKTGLSRTRARDAWYLNARAITADEYLAVKEIHDAQIAASAGTARALGADVGAVGLRQE